MSTDEESQEEEFYRELDELGEVEVDRRLHIGSWHSKPGLVALAKAWLRQQDRNRESRAVKAAEATAKSTKATALWVAVAAALAAVGLAWSVWGS